MQSLKIVSKDAGVGFPIIQVCHSVSLSLSSSGVRVQSTGLGPPN